MKDLLPHYKKTLFTAAFLAIFSISNAQTTVVDFGANYSSSNINTSDPPTSFVNGDFDFDGTSDDRAISVAMGQSRSEPNSSNWTTPSGKSGGTILYGYSLANINTTADDPAIGLNRYNPTVNTIQMTSGAGTAAMRMASAIYWEKSSFINGGDAAGPLSFANQAGSFSVDFVSSGTPTTGNSREARLLVRDGADWYISADIFGGTSGSLSINAAAANWHAYDPTSASLLFYDDDNLGTSITGSSFSDITAAGALVQHELFDGLSANAAQHGFQSVNLVAIPEPGTAGLLIGMFALGALATRRRLNFA